MENHLQTKLLCKDAPGLATFAEPDRHVPLKDTVVAVLATVDEVLGTWVIIDIG